MKPHGFFALSFLLLNVMAILNARVIFPGDTEDRVEQNRNFATASLSSSSFRFRSDLQPESRMAKTEMDKMESSAPTAAASPSYYERISEGAKKVFQTARTLNWGGIFMSFLRCDGSASMRTLHCFANGNLPQIASNLFAAIFGSGSAGNK